ncbi:hypothetical protein [Flavobacterium selenitireducens]|uniref:hypothetical protein n=1 Tax=Flavobacterium selenitireducens TaxID=2722704 RepID=UPI00168A6D67|nr:hypothetical protein [Flavobacterium selenitireducens]MBD3582861.1 hypothetical protein [Flavobacterium selenitireducens]
MKALTLKFFDVLEKNLSLKEFEKWLYSLDDSDGLKKSALWKAFYNFNYGSKNGYEFAQLLSNFDTDEYALYKFENTLKTILADGNLFRGSALGPRFQPEIRLPVICGHWRIRLRIAERVPIV